MTEEENALIECYQADFQYHLEHMFDRPHVRSRDEVIFEWENAGFGHPGIPSEDFIDSEIAEDEKRLHDWQKSHDSWTAFRNRYSDEEWDALTLLLIATVYSIKNKNSK